MGQCKSLRKFKDLFLDLLEFCNAKMKKKNRKKKTIKAWDQKVTKFATKPISQKTAQITTAVKQNVVL